MSSAMAADQNLIKVYRNLLNAECGKGLEAKAFTRKLVDLGIISDEEKIVIEGETNFSTRQFLLFLRILPSKGIHACRILVEILSEYLCTDSSKFLADQLRFSRDREFTADEADGQSEFVDFECISEDAEEVVSRKRIGPLGGLPEERADRSASASFAPPFAAVEQYPVAYIPVEVSDSRKLVEIKQIAKEFEIQQSAFELGPTIGHGGFANVHIAIYRNQNVAVKQFRHFDDFAVTMFSEEVNIMSQLHHPNILHFVGFVQAESVLWLVTEYIHGGSMRRFCEPQKSNIPQLSLIEKLNIAEKCWCGLEYLHTRNLCHKDISPGNILISDDLNDVKISDFGLAEFKQLCTVALTMVKGTAMYYPPEFATTGGAVRHPTLSDVYSMGASLCELFSEQYFWNLGGKRLSDWQVMFLVLEQNQALTKGLPVKDPDCRGAISPSVWNVLQYAVHADLHQRKTSAEMLQLTTSLL